jgi:hypothetical protein
MQECGLAGGSIEALSGGLGRAIGQIDRAAKLLPVSLAGTAPAGQRRDA